MAQVTIYLEPDVLEAAKASAARAHMSLSKWFAHLAQAEQQKAAPTSLSAVLDELERTYGPPDDGLDFLLDERTRYADLGQDAPRERFE